MQISQLIPQRCELPGTARTGLKPCAHRQRSVNGPVGELIAPVYHFPFPGCDGLRRSLFSCRSAAALPVPNPVSILLCPPGAEARGLECEAR